MRRCTFWPAFPRAARLNATAFSPLPFGITRHTLLLRAFTGRLLISSLVFTHSFPPIWFFRRSGPCSPKLKNRRNSTLEEVGEVALLKTASTFIPPTTFSFSLSRQR